MDLPDLAKSESSPKEEDTTKKDFLLVLAIGFLAVAFVVAILIATYISQASN